MALNPYAKDVDISKALTAFKPPGADEYFVAFGTNGRQFCATPNGYSAQHSSMHLPAKIMIDLTMGQAKVKKIVCASYGGSSDSWFFRYETHGGQSYSRFGRKIPAACRQFIEASFTSDTPDIYASLHVQLGSQDSFIAWTNVLWICHGVPSQLKVILSQESFQHTPMSEGLMRGVFKHRNPIDHVSWHKNGSFYIKGNQHSWNFRSTITKKAWDDLWRNQGSGLVTPRELKNLAYAAIDPHSADGDSFVFIKKKNGDQEAEFVLRFAPESTISRLTPRDEFVGSRSDHRLQHIPATPPKPKALITYIWARSKQTGRPHPNDEWELQLKKGEMVKVLETRGRGWYVVMNMNDIKGWVHEIWLDFNVNAHVDPREAYELFQVETEALLIPGTLRVFPVLSRYMNVCAEVGCKLVKQDAGGIGICAHDLERLLRGSGTYTVDFLKVQRNIWHPDKFARFCHPTSREVLQTKAGSLFVLFGILIDLLLNPPPADA
ncbi:hypothetical protein K504DRAFT_383596 [Pleomassaria siparia CBS 279.74]|uniref:SH3 domain-containing protein n=1 Tax=Pleomassaria siparia CBS 279.74 TaxID=1314801 RepID=A0A6G1K4Z6_9PLEO|nr:hypothetical protein K504DRAFT_383596 [Pleomassaria siparia CBS 279.74]